MRIARNRLDLKNATSAKSGTVILLQIAISQFAPIALKSLAIGNVHTATELINTTSGVIFVTWTQSSAIVDVHHT